MAKRKCAAEATHEHEVAAFVTDPGGVFYRMAFVSNNEAGSIRDPLTLPTDIAAELIEYETDATDTIKEILGESSELVVDVVGCITRDLILAAEPLAEVSFEPELDAAAVRIAVELSEAQRELLRIAQQTIDTVEAAREAIDSGDVHRTYAAAIALGTLTTMSLAILKDASVMRGTTVLNAARAGGLQARKLTDGQREAAKCERDQLIEAGHSKHDASQLVRTKYGVSYKTIERL